VKRDSVVRLNFHTRFNYDEESKTPFGFVQFGVRGVADFERYAAGELLRTFMYILSLSSPPGLTAAVYLRRPLQGRSSIGGRVPTVTLSVTAREPEKYRLDDAPWDESRGHRELRLRETLPLASYIIAHPVPKSWKVRRESDGRVYFFNIENL
jgi:hypothetical protein